MKKQQRPLAVGDFCLTVGSRYPANDGLRVVVVEFVPGRTDRGRPLPYTIQRVDGQMLPLCGPTNSPAQLGFCAGSRLRRIDINRKDDRDQLVTPADDLMQPAEDALDRWYATQGFEL